MFQSLIAMRVPFLSFLPALDLFWTHKGKKLKSNITPLKLEAMSKNMDFLCAQQYFGALP